MRSIPETARRPSGTARPDEVTETEALDGPVLPEASKAATLYE